jgi:coproporphyrinogen III oxidase-like Fe-S oxidoreductase
MARVYKDYKVYCCFTLNRLVSELGIDLYQPGLEDKLEDILKDQPRISKEEIEKLEEDGLVRVEKVDGKYEIKITKDGVLYVRKYNQFFLNIYREQIRDHYRYGGVPHWAREAER